MYMAIRVGVVLSGCGVFDGSEIHEAVSVLIALDKRAAQVICMAPNVAADAVNHLTKKPAGQKRSVLEESARIARGNIRDIATVQADELDALVFPGGFGAAKNLCSFATEGPNCTVNPQVERLVCDMVKAKKPIGLASIAPVLAASNIGKHGLKPKVTIGSDKGTADAINAKRGEHQITGPTDVCVDEANRLVTTPCYMNNVGPWFVFQGVDKMVELVLRMAQAR
jgi:enhancing lycopene biosynthesis protein 2